jgi:hypothetical protein
VLPPGVDDNPRPARGAGILRMRIYRRTVADIRQRDMRDCGVRGRAKANEALRIFAAPRRLHASGRDRLHAKPTCRSTDPERLLVPWQKPPSSNSARSFCRIGLGKRTSDPSAPNDGLVPSAPSRADAVGSMKS